MVVGRCRIQLRTTPPRNNQRAAINFAADYELGAVAQQEERRHGMPEATGSSPVSSIVAANGRFAARPRGYAGIMIRLLYKPFALLVGMLAGLLASQAFRRLWGMLSDEPPADPDDRDATWREVLVAATAQGAVYSLVQALIRRGGAKWFERATGVWPGDDGRG